MFVSFQPGTSESADSLYEVLSHPWRRAILWYLRTQPTGEPIAVRDLARVVESGRQPRNRDVVAGPPETEWLPGTTRHEPDLDTVEVALLHTHLPKLAAYDFLTFDTGSELVVPEQYTTAVLDSLRQIAAFTADLSNPTVHP